MRDCYFVSEYPAVSHTFIRREITELEQKAASIFAALAFRHGRWRELPREATALVAPRVTNCIGQARPAAWRWETELGPEPIRAANKTEWHRAETWNGTLEQEA